MRAPQHPLVSVVTPVYNGAPYLSECVESVLAQTYQDWDYIIVDNCSDDGTREIAQAYAAKDRRIRVHRNETTLPIMASHNRAVRLISPLSKYCKVISADDWLFPECLARMVDLAEGNPSVGIVGGYQLTGGGDIWYVRNNGLPCNVAVVAGREVCRAQLLGRLHVLGNTGSVLYRADRVRSAEAFYPSAEPESDVSACLRDLRTTDFGFVHQILSYERLHGERATTTALDLYTYLPAAIDDCLTYGPSYLTKAELEQRVGQLLNKYYRFLAKSVLRRRDAAFWAYHERRLREFGCPLNSPRLYRSIAAWIVDLLLNPKNTVQLALRRARVGTPPE